MHRNEQVKDYPAIRLIVKVILLAFMFLAFLPSSLFASREMKPKNILVLASYNPTSPVGFLWDRGIRSVFKGEAHFPININIEYLDLTRFNDDQYLQRLLTLYAHKYSKIKPDLIIPIYNGALGFLLEHGQSLFPRVPIVFAGVTSQFVKDRKPGVDITGLLSVNSYGKTLDLALHLQPDVRQVAVVSGAGIIGRRWGQNAWEAFRPYADRTDFLDLRGLPMEAILDKVSKLPSQTVVMYVTLLEDGAGEKFTAPAALSKISSVSSAPIYSFWDLMLGHGMVGGYLSSAEEKGKAVARLGLEILNGKEPDDIPFREEADLKYMFDWRELKRWSISEDKLPEGSLVKFKEFTFWDMYKGRIVITISLLLLEALLIFYLLIQRRNRRNAEQALEDRLRFEALEIEERLGFEKLIADLSSELILIHANEVDSRIHHMMSRVGKFMHVDRAYLFKFNFEKTEFSISHLWEGEDIQKDQVVRGVIVKEHFPWLAQNLLAGEDVVIDDVEIMSREEARIEYDYCVNMGIQSFLILPIHLQDSPLCAIGLDSIATKRSWPQEIRNRLRMIGENFAGAIARNHGELALKAAYEDIISLKERVEAESAYLQEEIKLDHNFENIIGQSEALKYVLYQVEQVAQTDSSVLILGETGTGKELIARAIHKLSPRGKRPLVKVNCAALPGELVESELFGREKGAFTGATSRQIGRFELADGSSLFLDEIGEMPLSLQAKLLRVLESGEFERLGNPKTLHSDVRIIASTNRNLEEEVREGRFREDLWYRLKVFTVTLPPLRKRQADVPLLIHWYMDKLSRKMGKPQFEIPSFSIQTLKDYYWPGNVRELKNMVESALITANGKTLNLKPPSTSAPGNTPTDFISLEEMERRYILQVLETNNWKIQGENSASSVLKIHPNTLRARMKKLGLKKPI